MTVEIILIQQYTLFIGPGSYSLIVILLTLLLMSGIGSRFAGRIPVKAVFAAIVIWILLDITLFTHLFYWLGALSMVPRAVISALLIAPLGFFMGMPFPKGAMLAGELVDWGFAVNGAASVLGSVAIILIAVSFGFSIAMLTGAALYICAYFLISGKAGWQVK